jgi:hypothetical protein
MKKPEWLDEANIKITLDARPLLAAGNHPLERVREESGKLNSGEIYEILTPFPPTPMIEKMEALGYDCYSVPDQSGLYHTYFLKK